MFMPSGVAAAAGSGIVLPDWPYEGNALTEDFDDFFIGYDAGTGAGSWSNPDISHNGYQLKLLLIDGGDDVSLSFGNNNPQLPDDNTSWSQVTITGSFATGSSPLVLTRSARTGYTSGTWRFNGTGRRFIDGNTYAVSFTGTP